MINKKPLSSAKFTCKGQLSKHFAERQHIEWCVYTLTMSQEVETMFNADDRGGYTSLSIWQHILQVIQYTGKPSAGYETSIAQNN